jgi:hypothetical protein
MEVALAIAVFALVYWFFRKREKTEQEDRELRWFSYSYGAPDGSVGVDWKFDFVAMSLVVDGFSADRDRSEPEEPATQYTLRRSDDGSWRTKITEGSRVERLTWLAHVMKKASIVPSLNEMRDAEFRELDAGPGEWKPLRDDIAAPLESQYQRFVRNYREGR